MIRPAISLVLAALATALPAQDATRQTSVSIVGEAFHLNGHPTYAGREWHGKKIEGLLLNSRMVQGIFDDLNPETRSRWAYPDSKRWDPDRNTREFVLSINLQGGSPEGCSGGGESDHDVFARVRIMGLLRSGHE